MTMVPEAWQNDHLMNQDKRDFYQWAAFAMEPWDGPGMLILPGERIPMIICGYFLLTQFTCLSS